MAVSANSLRTLTNFKTGLTAGLICLIWSSIVLTTKVFGLGPSNLKQDLSINFKLNPIVLSFIQRNCSTTMDIFFYGLPRIYWKRYFDYFRCARILLDRI